MELRYYILFYTRGQKNPRTYGQGRRLIWVQYAVDAAFVENRILSMWAFRSPVLTLLSFRWGPRAVSPQHPALLLSLKLSVGAAVSLINWRNPSDSDSRHWQSFHFGAFRLLGKLWCTKYVATRDQWEEKKKCSDFYSVACVCAHADECECSVAVQYRRA